jgi:branched-subunit amino acid transport protein
LSLPVEAAGYGARVVAHYKINTTLPYAIQSLFILLAPILFAASVYMYLGRIIVAAHGEEHSIIATQWLTKIFVCGDIFCFLIQGTGGGVMSGAKTPSRMHLGEHVILAGLVLQIVIFVFFVVVAAMFHMRMLAHPKPQRLQAGLPWQRLLLGLYAVSIFITTRNAVRAVEYGMGSKGYFLAHEWITYIFDAALMGAVLLICLLCYSSGVGPGVKQESIES